jgi:hypothetical protein
MLQMDMDPNLVDYIEFSAVGRDYRSPFVYDPEKHCHIMVKHDKVNFMSYYNCLQVGKWSSYTGAVNYTQHL